MVLQREVEKATARREDSAAPMAWCRACSPSVSQSNDEDVACWPRGPAEACVALPVGKHEGHSEVNMPDGLTKMEQMKLNVNLKIK